MDNKKFKELLKKIALDFDFKVKESCFYKESEFSIISFDLQKSNFGNFYYMNIKIFVQNLLNEFYTPGKNLVKNSGDINSGPPTTYNGYFDLRTPLSDHDRENGLRELFETFLVPLSANASSPQGLQDLSNEKKVFIFPRAKKALIEKFGLTLSKDP